MSPKLPSAGVRARADKKYSLEASSNCKHMTTTILLLSHNSHTHQ